MGSHGEPCDVQILGNFFFSFLLVSIEMGVCDLWEHLHLIETSCCMNVKFQGIKL